jgi:hypothetical protein
MKADRTRKLTFSSQQAVVQRWFGGEILDHSPGAVRMDFLSSGRAPLLAHHDMQQQIGVIDSARISYGVGAATARFGNSSAANEAMQNIDDGILKNTSVGYRVHNMTLASTENGVDTGRRQLLLPLTTIILAGLKPSSLIHHHAV